MASSTPPPPRTYKQAFGPKAKKGEHTLSTPLSEDLHSESEKQTLEEQPGASAPPAIAATDEQWVSGLRLLAIMAAVTLVCLLMLIDTSIIVTVRANSQYF